MKNQKHEQTEESNTIDTCWAISAKEYLKCWKEYYIQKENNKVNNSNNAQTNV